MPWPCGHFFINLIQKCLWAPPMTDLKAWKCGFKQCDCGEILVSFIFFVLGGIFSDFPQRTCIASVIWREKKNQHGVIKNRVVKWMIVCQKKFTSFPVSSMWVHATKWVQCSLLISRDQLSVIAHLKSKYQWEAETGELYLMEQHLRKSFGRWEEGRVSSYRDAVAYLMGDSELPIATMCQHRLSGLWALNLILGTVSEKKTYKSWSVSTGTTKLIRGWETGTMNKR